MRARYGTLVIGHDCAVICLTKVPVFRGTHSLDIIVGPNVFSIQFYYKV